MRFQLLGPLTLADGSEAVVLQPSKPTILLAALLLRANSVVSADYLQRAVWGEEQPATAKAALQTCVLRLRRLFTKHGVTETSIEAVPGGYRITAEPHTLDLLGFRDQVRRAVLLSHDPETELCELKDALSLWQGALLANVRSDVLHRDEVPRLAEERLRSVERVCDLLLGLGRHGEALVELWTATRVYPGHERLHEQLIEALYRTGRQTQALAEYRRVKEFLLDELGVDPSPGLQQLELTILRGEDLGPGGVGGGGGGGVGVRAPLPLLPGAGVGAGAVEGAVVPVPRPAAALVPAPVPAPTPVVEAVGGVSVVPVVPVAPAGTPVAAAVRPVPNFTGRETETAAMTARLTAYAADPDRHPPIVLVSGAPGVGKSALAHHVAHLMRDAFPGGRPVVRATRPDGEARPAAELAAEAYAALGADGAGGADCAGGVGSSGGAGGAGSAGGVDGARVLLVLDDVVDADQVRPLLPAVAQARGAVIVTSRMGLAGLVATHGGWVHRLSVFTAAESYALLVSVLGAERVEAEPEAARRLVGQCGHLPLALRILTARLLTRPALSLGDAVDWFGDDPLARLALPDTPDLSVTAVLDGALARLDPRLSEAFRRAATGTGSSFTADDVPGTTEAVLERLADAGLLEDGPPGPYRIHELLRAHARRTDQERIRRTEKV
ncbi:BTAD domain-containing putative transcriptional regulator [Streptomyces sp. NPDC059278]|uniref:BTAD domain-containing putative transcriptional regulator n=1 Tax=Streptomyces sp. NPDC059278 TaxID=3346801 RepID=UPI003674284C